MSLIVGKDFKDYKYAHILANSAESIEMKDIANASAAGDGTSDESDSDDGRLSTIEEGDEEEAEDEATLDDMLAECMLMDCIGMWIWIGE